MTPKTAISLSHDGISVLQRARRGWELRGSVELDHPNLKRVLRRLQEAAREAAGGAAASLLVIPNSEILYTRMTAPGPDDAAREAQIRQGLDGLTPYPVEDLVFVWSAEGESVAVAVVARETLDEAEAFATAHGLGAVGFAAFPDDPSFGTELFLAPTRAAPTEPAAVSAPASPVAAEVPRQGGGAERQDMPAAGAGAPADNAPPAQPAAAPETPAAASPADSAPPDDKPATPEAMPGAAPAFSSRRAPRTAAGAKLHEPVGSEAAGSAPAEPAETVAAGGGALSVQAFKAGLKGVTAKLRRGGEAEATSSSVRSSERLGRRAKEILSKKGSPSDGDKMHAAPGGAAASAWRPLSGKQAPDKQPLPAAGKAGATEDPDALKKALAAPVENLAARPTAGKSGVAAPPSSEAEKLTIFGARGNPPTSEGFGRRAVLLTVALLLVLAAVAVWASYFTADQPASPEDVALVDPGPQAPADPGAQAPADPVTQPEAPALAATDNAALPDADAMLPFDEQTAIDETLGAIDSDLATPLEPATGGASEPPPLGENDTPDVRAETAVPSARGTDPVVLSELTPPSAVASDLPALPASPAPFGTESVPGVASAGPGAEPLPEVIEGRPPSAPPVRPEGLAGQQDAALEPLLDEPVTPEIDRAAVDTALRPEAEPDVAATALSDRAAREAAAREAGEALFTVADDRFAALRPEARPGDADVAATAVPEVDAEALAAEISPGAIDPAVASADAGGDDIELAQASRAPPPGGIALAALRPEARPAALPEVAAMPAAPEIPGLDAAEPMAVAVSLQPTSRPAGFDERVAEIRAAMRASAPTQPTAAPTQPTAASAPMPSATPAIPSSASVARAATQPRAINTRQINLLGVAGSSGNRTALVRMANGSVERLRVGDRLDRGQVTAIGDDELVYVRGSRTIRLRIGQG